MLGVNTQLGQVIICVVLVLTSYFLLLGSHSNWECYQATIQYKRKDNPADCRLFVDVVPGFFPPLLTARSVVLFGDAAQAPGPAVLLFHEAGVEIRLVVRPADGLQRGRTDSPAARPLENGQTAREGNLQEEIIFQRILGDHFHKAASSHTKKSAISGCRPHCVRLELWRYL